MLIINNKYAQIVHKHSKINLFKMNNTNVIKVNESDNIVDDFYWINYLNDKQSFIELMIEHGYKVMESSRGISICDN